MNAIVYRPERNHKGDVIGTLDDYLVGEISGVVIGGPSVQPVGRFPGVMSTEGQLGIPWSQDSGIVVQQYDRLVMDGLWYAVTSSRLWTGDNVLTGSRSSYYWIEYST